MSADQFSSLYDSIVEGFSGGTGMSVREVVVILLMACLMGAYIYLVYKGFSKSAFYSRDLNVSMGGMTIVVAAIMVAMQSNLIVSLGMVGALSIVRFRTAVKNPLDLLYLFWSISAGIICGVGMYTLALVLCVIMTLAIWVGTKIPVARAPYVLIVRTSGEADDEALGEAIRAHSSYAHLSSSLMRGEDVESVYEVRTKSKRGLVAAHAGLPGVESVSCLEHDGEIRA